jgi:hypothetical protein
VVSVTGAGTRAIYGLVDSVVVVVTVSAVANPVINVNAVVAASKVLIIVPYSRGPPADKYRPPTFEKRTQRRLVPKSFVMSGFHPSRNSEKA